MSESGNIDNKTSKIKTRRRRRYGGEPYGGRPMVAPTVNPNDGAFSKGRAKSGGRPRATAPTVNKVEAGGLDMKTASAEVSIKPKSSSKDKSTKSFKDGKNVDNKDIKQNSIKSKPGGRPMVAPTIDPNNVDSKKDETIAEMQTVSLNDISLVVKTVATNNELVNETGCTAVCLLMQEDGKIMTSFLGNYNKAILSNFERVNKMYFKELRKKLKLSNKKKKD